jgi:hypothetical protein
MLDEFEEGSIFCSILPRMEGKAYRALRATRRKGLCPSTSTIVAGFLLLLLSLLTALPFLVVKTTSLDEANSVCFAKRGIPRTDTDVASFVYVSRPPPEGRREGSLSGKEGREGRSEGKKGEGGKSAGRKIGRTEIPTGWGRGSILPISITAPLPPPHHLPLTHKAGARF